QVPPRGATMIYCNLEELQRAGGQAEPPMPAGPPLQVLGAWERHLDPSTGRCFFYNPQMGTTSWKPPRRHREAVRLGGSKGEYWGPACLPASWIYTCPS
ncbi:RHG09 protein, partial [Balaeniceps rex]|nr:RHG09 protein [Balaeniceps rex]